MKKIIAMMAVVFITGTLLSSPAHAGRDSRRESRIIVGAIVGGLLGAMSSYGDCRYRPQYRQDYRVQQRYCGYRQNTYSVRNNNSYYGGRSAKIDQAIRERELRHMRAIERYNVCLAEQEVDRRFGTRVKDCSRLDPMQMRW